MIDFNSVLTDDERIVLTLRSLYSSHGFSGYRMSKFEEYDLYVKNKDFLVSEGVITFNDTDGRLLALKPDVTLSIIKNKKDGQTLKAYYNENVYRPDSKTHSFREIMQAGVECVGNIGLSDVCETVELAVLSLDAVSTGAVLEISHLDIISGVLNSIGISSEGQKNIVELISEKNVGAALEILNAEGLSDKAGVLTELVSLHGKPSNVIPLLKNLANDAQSCAAIDELACLCEYLDRAGLADKVIINTSVINNTRYYNGIAFRGFVPGAPRAVLLGGQYDKLVSKMKKQGRAVGFAVYVDELVRAVRG